MSRAAMIPKRFDALMKKDHMRIRYEKGLKDDGSRYWSKSKP
jgi:hypothetical protein